MAIRVFIQCETIPGNESLLYELLMKNRTRLIGTKGYISGETLCAMDDPGSFLIISTWDSFEHWHAWVNSKERRETQANIENLLKTPSVHHVYSCG
ncbi:MAG TPA: antibiotic biosynthesis monooxygenase family protein [Syntrophobacteria bacterium]|nr:antibiotic biosynthesis monooxygenase family protein [Syntrophobacteria bacterium]